MGISVNTSPQQITASVGETQIDVTVSGGIGPSGAVGGGYTLPTATASVLGGVKIGSGISIDGSGVISASSGYTLPTATSSVLGGVKIGSGVTITDGVISVSTNYAAASHTHAISDVTGLQTALDGKAAATHAASHAVGGADELFDQALNTTSSVAFESVTAGTVTISGSGAGNQLIIESGSTVYFNSFFAGSLLSLDGNGAVVQLSIGTAGQHLRVNSGATGVEWVTLGTAAAASTTDFAAASHTHAASAITSGTLDIARIPVGTSSTTVAAGNDSRLSDARTPTAHNHAASDINSGVLATARLASSGTASATTFLRGDQTWASAGSTSASDLTSGTLANARMTTRARASMNLYLWSAFR